MSFHRNSEFIQLRHPRWRVIRRRLLASIALVYVGMQLLRVSGLTAVDAADDRTSWPVMAAIIYSVSGLFVVAIVEIGRRAALSRPWHRFRRHPMLSWADQHGRICVARARGTRIDQPMLGAPKRQRIAPMSAWKLDDGRDARAFEARYYHEIGAFGQTRFLTGIAVELDPSWVLDLPQVTVSPSRETYVGGSQAVRDRRWESIALDSRFQFDAAVGSEETPIVLTQLFGPQVQLALGTTCCAYWQQTGNWLMVWPPTRRAQPDTLDALLEDALWIRSRYAELGRSTVKRIAS